MLTKEKRKIEGIMYEFQEYGKIPCCSVCGKGHRKGLAVIFPNGEVKYVGPSCMKKLNIAPKGIKWE